MTVGSAQVALAGWWPRSVSAARLVVAAGLVVLAVLAAVLLAGSRLPPGVVEARLGNSAGTYSQELVRFYAQRLVFAAAYMGVLAVAWAMLRRPLAELVEAALADARRLMVMGRPWSIGDAARLGMGAGLGGLMVLAIALRLAFVQQPMRYDEALTFNEFASRPLYYGLSFYPDPNNHLLNTLLMHLSASILGNQPWVLRLPALVAGVLLVPATWWLGSVLYGWRSGALAAAVVATSSYLVEYATNGRGYTLQALCFVVLFAVMVEARRRESRTALLLAAIVAAAGMYAIPTMVYGIAVVAIWYVTAAAWHTPGQVRAGHLAASLVVLAALVGVLYLPVVVVSGPDKLVSNRFVVPLDGGELLQELPRSLLRTWQFWNRDMPLPLVMILAAGAAAATAWQVCRRQVPLALLAVGVPLGLVLLQRVAPFERVWLFLVPVYAIIAAAGLVWLADRWLRGPAVVALGGVLAVALAVSTLTSGSIVSSQDTGAFADAEAVAHLLSTRLGPDDAVMTQLPASLPELQYYFPRQGLAIAALVRPPAEAATLYVITSGAAPTIDGWGNAVELARLKDSAVFKLQHR